MSRKKDIALAASLLAIVGIFAFGMIYWPDMPKDKPVLKDLYYITIASVLYMMSWVIFIIANSVWVKGASCLGIGVFSVNLYVAIFLDPLHWTKWNGLLIGFVSINMLISVLILERIKNNK